MKKIRNNNGNEYGAVMVEFAMVSVLMIPFLFGAILLLVFSLKVMLFRCGCMKLDEAMENWEMDKSIEEQVRQSVLMAGLGCVFGKNDVLTVTIDEYDDGKNKTQSKRTDIPYTVKNEDTGEEESWIYEVEEIRRKEVLNGTVQYDIDVNFILGRNKIHLKRKLDIEHLRGVVIQEHRIKDEGND